MEATEQAASGLESEKMASGTITLVRTGSGYLSGQILWSSQSNGSEANTSTVTAELQIQRSALNSTTGTFKGSFKVGSTSKTVSWYGTLPTYEWVTIETVTVTIDHYADGKGNCYLYALVNGPTGTTMEGTYVSGASTVTLDTIPRFASIISATDFTDESDPTITYSNPAGNAVELLQACISLDGSDDDVPYRDIPKTGTKYTFSLTEAERNTLRAAAPNSNSLQVKFFVRSKIGDDNNGCAVKSTMKIVNADPVVSSAIVDTNSATTALTGNSAILVALHSKAKVTVSATAKKYATIKSKEVTHGTVSLSGDGTLSVTNNPIKITVTDSRGNKTEQIAGNTIVPYINPTCVIGNNIPEADGSYALVVSGLFYNGKIGATTNALTVQYRCKASGGSYSDWMALGAVATNGNRYTATANLTGLDYQTVYTFQARAMDAIYTAGVWSSEIAVTSKPVFDWGKNDFRFNVPVNVMSGSDENKIGVRMWTDSEGGNLRVYPPEGKVTDYWDMDAYDGGFRIFAYKNATHPNGAGHVFPLTLNTDGSVSVGNTAKTRSRLGVAPGAESTSYPGCYYRTVDGVTDWINPPMIFGTEYRTTERCNGKVVYALRVNCGTLPNTTSKSVSTTIPSTATVVSAEVVAFGSGGAYSFPIYSSSGTLRGMFFITSSKNIGINTFTDMSAWTGYAIVKYTKD